MTNLLIATQEQINIVLADPAGYDASTSEKVNLFTVNNVQHKSPRVSLVLTFTFI